MADRRPCATEDLLFRVIRAICGLEGRNEVLFFDKIEVECLNKSTVYLLIRRIDSRLVEEPMGKFFLWNRIA
jgi:hypothetical protein